MDLENFPLVIIGFATIVAVALLVFWLISSPGRKNMVTSTTAYSHVLRDLEGYLSQYPDMVSQDQMVSLLRILVARQSNKTGVPLDTLKVLEAILEQVELGDSLGAAVKDVIPELEIDHITRLGATPTVKELVETARITDSKTLYGLCADVETPLIVRVEAATNPACPDEGRVFLINDSEI